MYFETTGLFTALTIAIVVVCLVVFGGSLTLLKLIEGKRGRPFYIGVTMLALGLGTVLLWVIGAI